MNETNCDRRFLWWKQVYFRVFWGVDESQIQKRVIPLNQAQFADGIRGVVCQVWTTGSLVLGKFRLFWVDFGHFQYGAISF